MNMNAKPSSITLCILGASVAALCCTGTAVAQADQMTEAVGGGGGTQFVARCPRGELLSGFELRAGSDVDAIRPICRVAYEVDKADTPHPSATSFGGPGGGIIPLVCPDETPIVTALYVMAEGQDTVVVNDIHVWCGFAATTQTPVNMPTVVFDGPRISLDKGAFSTDVRFRSGSPTCPPGLVGVGIHGRSGSWLDAVGLICGKPKLTPYIKSIGRIRTGGPTTPDTRSFCDKARDARARNSPAAPSLEALCEASKKPPAEPPGTVTEAESTASQVQAAAVTTAPTAIEPDATQAATAVSPPGAGTTTAAKALGTTAVRARARQ